MPFEERYVRVHEQPIPKMPSQSYSPHGGGGRLPLPPTTYAYFIPKRHRAVNLFFLPCPQCSLPARIPSNHVAKDSIIIILFFKKVWFSFHK